MGDWNLPALISNYADFLNYLASRDFDAISLGVNAITNPQAGMMRYIRASNRFQEFDGTAWQDKILSIAAGGTSANTAAGARAALGIGGLAAQDPNNVLITGGSITGLATLGVNGSASIGGDLDVNGVIFVGTGNVQPFDSTGKIQALNPTYFASLNGSLLTNLNGAAISSGQIPVARMGTGTPNANTVLLGDGTWGVYGMFKSIQVLEIDFTYNGNTSGVQDFPLTTALTDYTKAFISEAGINGVGVRFKIINNNNVRLFWSDISTAVGVTRAVLYIVEAKNVG
jgi:hypothetical protein